MKININNYELFVIDYLEGKLDAIKTKEMQAFLLVHPYIARELEGFDELVLSEDWPVQMDKDIKAALKNPEIIPTDQIDENNYENVFAAQLEGDLNPEEQKDLEVFLKENPFLLNEYQQSQLLKIRADKSIVFKYKEQLKKKDTTLRLLYYWAASIAAIVLLSLWWWPVDDAPMPRVSPQFVTAIQLQRIPENSAPKVLKEIAATQALPIASEMINEERENIQLERLASIKLQVEWDRNEWQDEMLLMQAYVFDKQQLHSLVDINSVDDEKGSRALKLLASLVWRTTKGQVKNIQQEVLPGAVKFREKLSLESISGGVISFDKPIKDHP